MKKKIEKTIEDEVDINKKNILEGLLKSINGVLASQVTTENYIPSPIKALNFIMSGDVNKGLPEGKITCFAGEQQTCKSLFGALYAVKAQKMGYHVLWLDSERASDNKFFIRAGLNPNEIAYKQITSAEELLLSCISAFDYAKENNIKVFIVLDSLGAILGNKESQDAKKGIMVTDMGARAKDVKAVLTQLISRVADTKSIMYIVNHLGTNPGQGNYVIKEMRGGKAPYFLSQIIFYLTRLKGKDDNEIVLRFKSKKNREYPENAECEVTVSHKYGINENDGMLEIFQSYDLINKKGGWWEVTDKDGNVKSKRPNDIFGDKELMEYLEEKLTEKAKDDGYSTFSDDIKE